MKDGEKSYFPFEGTFPNYTYSEAARTSGTSENTRLLRFVKNNLCEEGQNEKDVIMQYSARDIAIYIANKYEIITQDSKEKEYESEFSDHDIDRLVRLRYALELGGFSAVSDYTVIENASDALIAYVSERHLLGVRFDYKSERVYNYDGYASHILGSVGLIPAGQESVYLDKGYSLDDIVGRDGCEKAFEEYLRGQDGVLVVVENEAGEVVGSYYEKEPVPGKDVYLTIDIDVQIAAEKALRENIENRINAGHGGEADSGAVVATDPKTGGILAIASYPTYSLTTFGEDYDRLASLPVSPFLNRALLSYAPGSTFKVGMALAALERGLIDEDTVMHTEGIYKGLACSHYVEGAGHVCCGDINVGGALEVSCNYFFSVLGDQLTIDTIRDYSSAFGFGEWSGIEFGESTEGKIASTSPHAAAIGQAENLCTPLQVSQYISMIANGGVRYSAHLLYGVKEADKDLEIIETAKEIGALDVSEKNLSAVKEGMYLAVSGDDASSLVRENFVNCGGEYKIGGVWEQDKNGNPIYVGGVSVAGKTGTAETAASKAGKCSDNAWFTGFAPYNDPEITVTCFIEKGITGGYSSYTVAKTMDAYFATQRTDAGSDGAAG